MSKNSTLPSIIITLSILIGGCTTRQVTDNISGSTAQRLVTYSLERFVTELVDQPEFAAVAGEQVNVKVHFLNDHPLLEYARLLVGNQLMRARNTEVISGEAAFEVNVFFNSIGTDHDSYGLSLPTLGLISSTEPRFDVLSVDMFHGITEGYATVKDSLKDRTDYSKRLLSRVRVDGVTTPVITFPINELNNR